MNSDKFIFIDRDGVIVRDKNYLYKIEDMEFLPGVTEGMKKIQNLGFQFVIISNQAGIARNLYTENDAKAFNNELVRRLNDNGISILACYFCPHHPDFSGECECRKPKIGLVEMATKNFGIIPSQSIFIGDKDCDIELGKKCSGITLLINNGQYKTIVNPDFMVKNLVEAAEIVSITPTQSKKI